MRRRPSVPPLRGRDVLTTPSPTPATNESVKVMVYLPAELLDELDGYVVEARRQHGRRVNRSAVIRAAVEYGLRSSSVPGHDPLMDFIGEAS